MGMIDRYKKRGGFIQLVNLLETMGTEKREKYMGLIAAEEPTWEAALKQKMISIERLSHWNPTFLMEFLPEMPIPTLSKAFGGMSEEKRALFFAALPFGVRKKVEDAMKDAPATANEAASGQMKILTEARNMILQGKLKLDKCDPELMIPEDIEDKLGSSSHSAAVAEAFETSTHSHAAGAGAGAGGNTAGSSDELALLRRKLLALSQENQRLQKEVNDFKVKIEAVKSALSKSA
jgi:hypothetical protein